MSHPAGVGTAHATSRAALLDVIRGAGQISRVDLARETGPHGSDRLHRGASSHRRRPRGGGRPGGVDRRQARRAALARAGGAVRDRRAPRPRGDHLRHRRPRRCRGQPLAAARRRRRRPGRRGRPGRVRAAHPGGPGGRRPRADPRPRRRLARPDHPDDRVGAHPAGDAGVDRLPARRRAADRRRAARAARERRHGGGGRGVLGRPDRRVQLLRRALHGDGHRVGHHRERRRRARVQRQHRRGRAHLPRRRRAAVLVRRRRLRRGAGRSGRRRRGSPRGRGRAARGRRRRGLRGAVPDGHAGGRPGPGPAATLGPVPGRRRPGAREHPRPRPDRAHGSVVRARGLAVRPDDPRAPGPHVLRPRDPPGRRGHLPARLRGGRHRRRRLVLQSELAPRHSFQRAAGAPARLA